MFALNDPAAGRLADQSLLAVKPLKNMVKTPEKLSILLSVFVSTMVHQTRLHAPCRVWNDNAALPQRERR